MLRLICCLAVLLDIAVPLLRYKATGYFSSGGEMMLSLLVITYVAVHEWRKEHGTDN